MNRLPAVTAALLLSTARFVPFDAITGQQGQTVFGEDLNLLDLPGADHKFMSNYWAKVADIVAGSDRMREMHDEYLPKFTHETAADYDLRWKNAKFTNVYRDIVENLSSKPFEEEVQLNEGDEKNPVTIPEQIVQFCEDVDGSGNNLTIFAADTFFNGVNAAIDWIFVDYSQAPTIGRPRTRAEEATLNLRPFWSHVLGSNVLEVRSRIVNGKERITYIRVREYEEDGLYIRLMRSDEFGAAWELYKEVPTNDQSPAAERFRFVESGPFTIGLIPMIPFITGRRMGKHWRFHPMMQDAADLQIELFQQESGLKNIKNLSAFPILSGEGVVPQYDGTGANKVPRTVATGPNGVLYGGMANDKPGKWDFIQPDASLLKFLAEDVEATIKQLRELGRQPLTAQSGNLTVITTAVAAKKGNSAVQMWALGLKDALENALVLTCLWFGIQPATYDPNVTVFTDFDVEGRPEDVNALNEARKNGDISRPNYLKELRRRGILRAEFDEDQNDEELLLEEPEEPEIDETTGLPKE